MDLGMTSARSHSALLAASICVAVGLSPGKAAAADRGRRWELGVDAGYVITSRNAADLPEKVHGASLGLGLRYEIDPSWFVGLDARLDLHQSYQIHWPTSADETTTPPADEAPSEPTGPTVDRFLLSSLALGLGYNLDVYRVVPYLGLWLVGLRVDQVTSLTNAGDDGAVERVSSVQQGYDLGGRLNLGVDYDLTTNLTIGLGFNYEWFFTGATSYEARLMLLARGAYRFGTPMN